MAECLGKYKFSNLREAEKACFNLWTKDPRLKLEDLHAYQCPHCHKYHVGHKAAYEKILRLKANAKI